MYFGAIKLYGILVRHGVYFSKLLCDVIHPLYCICYCSWKK